MKRLLLLLALAFPVAFAQDTTTVNFGGVTLGTGYGSFPYPLTYLNSDDEALIYTRDGDPLRLNSITADQMFYVFENDIFVSGYAPFTGRSNFDYLMQTHRLLFGEPDSGDVNSGRYVWQGSDVQIQILYKSASQEGTAYYLYLP